jgi:hypothetical protein
MPDEESVMIFQSIYGLTPSNCKKCVDNVGLFLLREYGVIFSDIPTVEFMRQCNVNMQGFKAVKCCVKLWHNVSPLVQSHN